MSIKQTAIDGTLNYWKSIWYKLVVTNEDESQTAEKTITFTQESDRLLSTVFFGSGEAVFPIKKVKLYDSSDTLLAEEAVNVNKGDGQSLTLIRKDILEV